MYDDLISLSNLFSSWKEFRKGKQRKPDVQLFERFLEDNIFALHEELRSGTYEHGRYETFNIFDPKPRIISKANVRDRLVHHVIFKELYSRFDPLFVSHSYASRNEKGTHMAVKNLSDSLRKISHNNTCPVYALKCDVRKFFRSISHKKLLQLIEARTKDKKFFRIVEEVVRSFPNRDKALGGGITGYVH